MDDNYLKELRIHRKQIQESIIMNKKEIEFINQKRDYLQHSIMQAEERLDLNQRAIDEYIQSKG